MTLVFDPQSGPPEHRLLFWHRAPKSVTSSESLQANYHSYAVIVCGMLARLLFISAVFLFSMAASAQVSNELVTNSGARYLRVEGLPAAMGVSYQDPSGLIWGDLQRGADGQFVMASQTEARKFCHGIQIGNQTARLPNKNDFFRFRESMSTNHEVFAPGGKGRIYETYDGDTFGRNLSYSADPEALPNLLYNSRDHKRLMPAYWSDEPVSYDPDSGYRFNVITGIFEQDSSGNNFRCVVDTTKIAF
jgi:hypothetical protein